MAKGRHKKRGKKLLITLGVLLLLALIGWGSGMFGGEQITRVEVQKAQKRTIVEKVTASGKLRPAKEIKITADVSGEIVKLPVKEGQKVQKGDLLAQINQDIYVAAVERATASLNNAKANLANAKAQLSQAEAQFQNAKQAYKRNKRLYEKEAISESEFEQIEADYRVKKAQVEAARQTVKASMYNVESAKANLQEAKDNLNKTEIYAPADGTISRLGVEAGERVVGTRQMSGTEIMRVANLDQMRMIVEVNENDIIRIREGDTAEIEVDAFVDRTFEGVVSHVANSAIETSESTSTDQVTNFEVEVDILKRSYEDLIDTTRQVATPFRPGMSGMVRIRTEKKQDVVSVPILAVTTRQKMEEGNTEQGRLEEVVFLYKDGKAVRQKVTTGIQDNYFIHIKKGIEAGQEVISGPYSAVSKELEDGMPIESKSQNKKAIETES